MCAPYAGYTFNEVDKLHFERDVLCAGGGAFVGTEPPIAIVVSSPTQTPLSYDPNKEVGPPSILSDDHLTIQFQCKESGRCHGCLAQSSRAVSLLTLRFSTLPSAN